MKKFITLSFLLVAVSCFLLKIADNYPWNTVGNHLIVMSLLLLTVCAVNLAVTGFGKSFVIARVVFHVFNFLFLTLLVVFYLLVLGSNFFWGKTITLKIMKNYFNSLGEFINTIPVEKGILLAVPVLLLLILLAAYHVTKPSYEVWRAAAQRLFKNQKKMLLISVSAFLLVFLLRHQIIAIKRRMHFADEPFLVFTLGSMWQGKGEKMAFDRQRYENGAKDRACLDAIHPSNIPSTQNFVVILVDGLRADHLSFYGYNRTTSPFLDSLYKAGHLSFVRNAFSPSNNTIGGVAGLFYSRDWDKFGYDGLNIPKFLKKFGYRNYAFLTGFHKEWYGLSALYRNDCDFYYESSMNYDENNRVDDDMKTLEVIRNTKLDRPSFMYIHLLSVHHVGKKYEQFKKFMPDKLGFGVDKKEALVNNYDNGVLQMDFIIKEIFSKLETDRLLPNATVFIVADHGELFGEDGRWSHGGDLHEKLLEIPILMYDNRVQMKNTESGSLLDIGPTIAERLGYPSPSCWQGFSLLQPSKDFRIKVFSNDDNIEFPNGTLEKKDSVYTFQIIDKNNIPVQTKEKINGSWVKKENELSKKNH